ncbi:MAG: hypothetical protein CMJ78_15615 [Planctomycetaceae bacterium]|nr:hypothetical protein [Planctomycetaceae bacterium]
MSEFDFAIIGQGIAGTTLAWHLFWQGARCVVVDDQNPNASSRVAGGLITPITGMRLVPSWRFDDFWPVAVEFYRKVEEATGEEFLSVDPSVRVFATNEERDLYEQKREELSERTTELSAATTNGIRHDLGGMLMTSAARVDVPAFLDASRQYLESQIEFVDDRIDIANEIELSCNSAEVPRLSLRARQLVLCQGFQSSPNPWFADKQFDAAKGEMITVEIPGLNEHRVVHKGIWLAPLGDHKFLVGATYDRDNLDHTPTSKGRAFLYERLEELVALPFRVINQAAAVRPILMDKRPATEFHHEFPQLAYFNGLGSKGCLQAPLISREFAAQLVDRLQ